MIKIIDTWTGDELEYENIEDFSSTIKSSYDEDAHTTIDQLADAYTAGADTSKFELELGIEIID